METTLTHHEPAPTPAVIFDASSLTVGIRDNHLVVTTQNGHVLATEPGTTLTNESVYQALGNARGARVPVATVDGTIHLAEVAMYVPTVGVVTTADRVYRTGNLPIPTSGLPSRIDSDNNLRIRGTHHPPIEVVRDTVESALLAYAA